MHLPALQAKRAELGSELSVLRSRREQLSSVVASTPKPAASQKVLTRLQQASEHLQLLQSLQVRRLRGLAAVVFPRRLPKQYDHLSLLNTHVF